MNKKTVFIFFVILALGFFLRFYRLSEIPPGVNQDEASIGYTAYSLLQTGKDEYGQSFPLSFQSFGDWKLPFYIYSVVPLVSILGFSELAVRLPSAVFGTLTIFLIYFLVKELFSHRATQSRTQNNAEIIALLTSFLLAISPWHIHLSRVESESNTAVFFITLAVFLFLKSLKTNWLIILSGFFFALTYFIYAGNHIFTTLLVLGLIFIYRKEIPKTKLTFLAALIFIAFSGFIFYQTLFVASKTKISGIGIFGDPSVIHAKIEIPRNEHQNPNSLLAKISHNKAIFALTRFGENYLNAFSPEFLFIKGGDNKAHNIENFGNMYLIEAPFLFLGLLYLFVFRKGKERKLILFWFLISPLAASITKDAPHANRMFAIFPILPLVTAFGIYFFFNDFVRKKLVRVLSIFLIGTLFTVNIAIYLDRYYVHFPRNEVANWGLGYKKLNEILSKPEFSSKKIVMNRPQYSPYIYLLFYSKFDPDLYQKSVVRYPPTEDAFVHIKSFDRFEFREIDFGRDVEPNSIVVSYSQDVPDSVQKSFRTMDIGLPNGKPMFTIVEPK